MSIRDLFPCRHLAVHVAIALVCQAVAFVDVAQARTDEQRSHDIVPEDYFTLTGIGAFDVSPDGSRVAFLESRWNKDRDGRSNELWIASTRGMDATRLTFDDAQQGNPTWSPDGKYIYYSCNPKRSGETEPPYDGKTQVWRMLPDGSEARAITRVEGGISSFQLSDDGKAIYYTTRKEHIDEEWKDLRTEFKELSYGHGITKFHVLSRIDLTTWRTRKLVDENRVIRGFHVAPDESMIAMVSVPDGTLLTHEGQSRIDIYDAKSEEITIVTADNWRANHPSPYGWIDQVTVSPDSKAAAFTISFDGYPPLLYVAEKKDGNFTLTTIERPKKVSIVGGSAVWRGSKRDLCFIGDIEARQRVYCVPSVQNGGHARARTVTPGDEVVIGRFDYDRSGKTLVVFNNTLDNAGDLYHAEGDAYRRITKCNPQIDEWRLPQISRVQWTAPDGAQVEGILELPHDHNPDDGPLPLVVEIHGGPTSATHYRFRLWIYGRALMPAQGYALLSPNYRGSTGYGDDFMIDLVGRENDIEVKDILAGVDAMIERGIADPDRMAVMGWSNGGYLTNCLITTTDRFKAASSGAGVLDQVLQWAMEDTPGHVINYMQALPWENVQAFLHGSPMYRLDKVSTPTLIHVGENDERVPAAHAQALYRALMHYLDIPTELIVYPGAGHGLSTYQHRLAKMKWDLAWFEKYLVGDVVPTETDDQSADESSPGES
ncbi:MAG: S9 family peptidase [Phycisphaerae bacterium]